MVVADAAESSGFQKSRNPPTTKKWRYSIFQNPNFSTLRKNFTFLDSKIFIQESITRKTDVTRRAYVDTPIMSKITKSRHQRLQKLEASLCRHKHHE